MKKIIGLLFIAFSLSAVAGISSDSSFAENDVIEMSIADIPSYDNSEIVELTVVSSFELSDTLFVVGHVNSEAVAYLGITEVPENRYKSLFEQADTEFNKLYSYPLKFSILGVFTDLNLTANRSKFIDRHRISK